MEIEHEVENRIIEEEARKSAPHHLAEGKGSVPVERSVEWAEQRLSEEMTRRARSGEHFRSSLPRD